MKLASRHEHLSRALDDWQARGLLSPDQAAQLRSDLGPREAWSFARFALLAGAVCLGLAALSFVAANWDDMARGWRLILVLSMLWLAWAGAAVAVAGADRGGAAGAAGRGGSTRFEALALLATLLFGAAIALVSQIFQLQGALADLLLLWAAGGLAGALLAQSRAALALAVVLIAAWDLSGFERGALAARDVLVLGGLALAAWGAWGLRAALAGRLGLAALLIWALGALLRLDMPPAAVVLGLTLLPGAVGLALWSWAGSRQLRGIEAEAMAAAMALLWLGLLALFLLAGDWDTALRPALGGPMPAALPGLALAAAALWLGRDGAARHDLAVALGAVLLVGLAAALPAGPWPRAALMLALPVWAVRMGGRHAMIGLRRLGTLGFGAALLAIYLQTVGSLLGTAALYAGAGAMLIAGAWGWRRWGRG